jgi:hypothetical protein
MTALRCRQATQTHSGVLLQPRTLEVPVADNLRGVGETDRDRSPAGNMGEESGPGESARTRHQPRKGSRKGG